MDVSFNQVSVYWKLSIWCYTINRTIIVTMGYNCIPLDWKLIFIISRILLWSSTEGWIEEIVIQSRITYGNTGHIVLVNVYAQVLIVVNKKRTLTQWLVIVSVRIKNCAN